MAEPEPPTRWPVWVTALLCLAISGPFWLAAAFLIAAAFAQPGVRR